ncbi:MAG: hypothetical protein AAGA60_28075 [Cyanobacteria bacterium P01_E01_bin.42]
MIPSLFNRHTSHSHNPPPFYGSEKNQDSLSSLKRAIALARGEYSLILARCESPRLRQNILKQISASTSLILQEVNLHPSVVNLLDTLEDVVRSSCADALVVKGLESVVNLDPLLEEANFIRNAFNRSLHLPVVLWVNEKTLHHMKRIAPDFSNYGAISISFES